MTSPGGSNGLEILVLAELEQIKTYPAPEIRTRCCWKHESSLFFSQCNIWNTVNVFLVISGWVITRYWIQNRNYTSNGQRYHTARNRGWASLIWFDLIWFNFIIFILFIYFLFIFFFFFFFGGGVFWKKDRLIIRLPLSHYAYSMIAILNFLSLQFNPNIW